MEEMISTYNILVGEPEGKRPLVRPKRRWEDNIRMDLLGNRVLSCGLETSGSVWNQWRGLVSTAISIQVPLKARNFLRS
jgi:hypothetical protein